MAEVFRYFVQCLENEGVECVFDIPGEEKPDLSEFLRNWQIKLVFTLPERPAGFMAVIFGRLTGRTCVSLTTFPPVRRAVPVTFQRGK